MANEELHQRGYLSSGKLKGDTFGDYERLNIGGTTIKELKANGVSVTIPGAVKFPFKQYKAPKQPQSAKPDQVILRREGKKLVPVATAENKAPTKLRKPKELESAAEQGLYAAAALGVSVAVTSDGKTARYVDVEQSLKSKSIVYFNESRDFVPSVLDNLLAGNAGVAKDPKPLAESVWQMIWHATKEEPKQCLLTFVEIFVLKFLSDNLPTKLLPQKYRFDALLADEAEFEKEHGVTPIEYYVAEIRPFIKKLFPDNTIANDPTVADTFGLGTVVSKTSVLNGFAFLKSSTVKLESFNRTFLDILKEFQKFGALTTIDPEFKLKLYETFLRRSARQQKLGQFFTPRSVVRPMVKMARLDTLKAGAVVLDPAAGVGGFILEPGLLVPKLAQNLKVEKGEPHRKIKFIGVDVDANTHILAKANTLIHFAELVRDPAITMPALNQLMAQTFVLMNNNETLGSLENPPQEAVDVILTNPPYVTRGSAIYKDTVKEAGTGQNDVDLREYYEGAGLGVEALFLRYISGALKPGGRAFVIVPTGMLNRTEPGPKKRLLAECNVLASIALPRNTFFNTAQLTYILVLERRHSKVDPRPEVFCGIARTIGETLNWERVPEPTKNDLAEIAEAFVAFTSGGPAPTGIPFIKVAKAEEFSENDRWDVTRFWTGEELVALGQREEAVPRVDFIDETRKELDEIADELDVAKQELVALTSGATMTLSLSDTTRFTVRSGSRITNKQVREHPGSLPVYSCFKTDRETKGSVDEKYYVKTIKGDIEEQPVVTVNANGASVGKVFVRRERCVVTDDVIVVEITGPEAAKQIDLDYFATALRAAVEKGGFIYEAKLFTKRVRELEVEVPMAADGTPDVVQQTKIATAVKRFENLRARLADLGTRAESARTI